jgi:hypothetical protein
MNLKQELGKLKEEMRKLQGLKVVMVSQQLWHEQEICGVKYAMELLRNASDSQKESQEQEAVGLGDGSSGWTRGMSG